MRRCAYEAAVRTYTESFDKTVPPEEVLLQEAQEEALQAALNTFNLEAVGGGTSRKKYGKDLYIAVKKQFEIHKRQLLMEAELQCLRAVGGLEERMRNACHVPNASYESLITVIDGLVAEYEVSVTGSIKWQKLVRFLQKSLAGSLQDLVKRENGRILSAHSALELQIKSVEEKIAFLQKQVDVAQKSAQVWKKRYELSISDYKKATDSAAAEHAITQKKVTALEERHTTMASKLEATKKEAAEGQSKYQHLLNEQRKEEERVASEIKVLQNRCTTAEARLAATREQCEAAKEEAAELRHKHETVEADTKVAIERATVSKDRAIRQAQLREDALRADCRYRITKGW